MSGVSRSVTVMAVSIALTGCVPFMVGSAVGAGGVANAEYKAAGTMAADTMIGAAVMVTFTKPNDLAAVRSKVDQHDTVQVAGPPGDSLQVRSVSSIIGRIAARNSDAMLIRVTETNGTTGKKTFGGKYVVTVTRDSNTTVQVLSSLPGRPHAVLMGVLVGLVVGFIWLIHALSGT